MKNSNYLRMLILLLAASAMTSCQKETILFSNAESNTNEVISDLQYPTSDLGKDEKELFSSVEELSTVAFDVTITMTTCNDGGVILTATNPDSTDPNFFANEDYEVIWTQNNLSTVYAEGVSISCVCGSGFRVKVTDGNGVVANASVDTPPC